MLDLVTRHQSSQLHAKGSCHHIFLLYAATARSPGRRGSLSHAAVEQWSTYTAVVQQGQSRVLSEPPVGTSHSSCQGFKAGMELAMVLQPATRDFSVFAHSTLRPPRQSIEELKSICGISGFPIISVLNIGSGCDKSRIRLILQLTRTNLRSVTSSCCTSS